MLTKEERINIAKKFADKVIEKYGDFVKSIILAGSVVREEFRPVSDIDVVLIIDDTQDDFSREMLSKFDEDLGRIADSISEAKIKIKNPITGEESVRNLLSLFPTFTLTEFWDYARMGHPILYNLIRESIALYDSGVFKPIQRLWMMGKIPTTREAIENYIEEVPKKINRAKTLKLLILAEDCYYAMLNSAQSILMFMVLEPPVPSKIYDEVKKYFVEPGILESEYAEWLKEIVEIRKKIEHKEILEVKGEFVDLWIERAEKFVNKMFYLLNALEIKKMGDIAINTSYVMYKGIIQTLLLLNIPIDEKLKEVTKINSLDKFLEFRRQIDESTIEQLKENLRKNLIEPGYVDPVFLKVWDRVEQLRTLVENKKVEKLKINEIYEMREAVRLFIGQLFRALKKLGVDTGNSMEDK